MDIGDPGLQGTVARLTEEKEEQANLILALQQQVQLLQKKLPVPMAVLTDSYKAGHFLMYPDADLMSAYGEFRAGYPDIFTDNHKKDTRLVFYGLDYIIKTYLERQWTHEDVTNAEIFYNTHNTANTPYKFPKDLFLQFINENNGYFPVRIDALPEGTVVNAHTPVFIITAEGDYSHLCTFLESVLTMVWYPTTVATLSRHTKELIRSYEYSVPPESRFTLDYKLHDFGFRACTCVEQSLIGGQAHLLNFRGSDTMGACFNAQFNHNDGTSVANSVPASEHSVMTSWPTELAALRNMIQKYGKDIFVSCVMDSYDYEGALEKVLPIIRAEMLTDPECKCTLVLRPDSGNPVDMVLAGLRAAEKYFPVILYQTENQGLLQYGSQEPRSYKIIERCSVIQGDGITYDTIRDILDAVTGAGFSAVNVVFGMGGGLLQKVNRDTMSFATKLSHIKYARGAGFKDIRKMPKTDATKFSLPGLLDVRRDRNGRISVYPLGEEPPGSEKVMTTVYNCKPVPSQAPKLFDEMRADIEKQWEKSSATHNPLSPAILAKMAEVREETLEVLAVAEAEEDRLLEASGQNWKKEPYHAFAAAAAAEARSNAMTDMRFAFPRRHRS